MPPSVIRDSHSSRLVPFTRASISRFQEDSRWCILQIRGVEVEAKYLRMIQRMKESGRKEWAVYILRCGDGSLYTGIAKDVLARVKQHNEGRGAAYTRTRLPVTLLYHQEGFTRSSALIREAQIKALSRSQKEQIISGIAEQLTPAGRCRVAEPPEKREPHRAQDPCLP